ncbi:MAG: epoxide hydrolase family protein, partial [Stackebrandtia sp.]
MTAHSSPVSNAEIRPFLLDVPQSELDDLDARLAAARWPAEASDQGWSHGAPVAYLKDLVDYWRRGYDWRAQEARFNAHPQFSTEIDGENVYFLHVRSPEPGALPLIVSHGWPSSPAEFLDVIAPLTDPRSHGGDPSQAFHLVIPSPPGYGLSGPTRRLGWGSSRVARAWAELMRRLGYDRYGACGSEWGTWISRELGAVAPDSVLGVHGCGFVSWPSGREDELDGLDDVERERLAFAEHYMNRLYGYKLIQSSRPQAIACGLTDSPAGLAAWTASVYKDWTDCV